jgi:hypothetical protein
MSVSDKLDKIMEDPKLNELIDSAKKRFNQLLEESDIKVGGDEYEKWVMEEHYLIKEEGWCGVSMLVALLSK